MMRGGFLLTLLAAVLLSGCAGLPPEPIVEYRTVEIVRDRYVSVPEWMTAPVEIVELSADFDLPELGAAYKSQRIRAQQCNGQLVAIAKLREQEN
jgi:hypothetical protein